MAYTNRNHRQKQEHAWEITQMYYEPGRQDRCHLWVWKKYIKEMFHVEYPTYMSWIRTIRKEKEASGEYKRYSDD